MNIKIVGIVTTLRAGHPRDRVSIPCGVTLLSPLSKTCRLAPSTPVPAPNNLLNEYSGLLPPNKAAGALS